MSTSPHLSILVVDDEPDLRTLYELTLTREGYDVESAATVDEAWALLSARAFNAVITDMRLPDGSGIDLLQRMDEAGRAEKAIVITAYGSAENAVEALKAGAYDYLTKPVDLRQFRASVASALGRTPAEVREPTSANTRRERAPVKQVLKAIDRLVGDSAPIRQVRVLVNKVGRSMAPVLVHGESGTGKELAARAIHDASPRAAMPFLAVNCGAIPENLLEAEFFGYRKGAFTGASEDREGFFMAAQGGTLFLDEIGDLPLSMQSKLLRVIQERAVRPLGSAVELQANVRVISATHKDLAAEVQAGRFRQDLYYRINVIQIVMPPLRERMGDLPAICSAVLHRIAAEAGVGQPPQVSEEALRCLAGHPFPGNVRELENMLHRAVALSDGAVVEREDLGLVEGGSSPAEVLDPLPAPSTAPMPPGRPVAAGLPGALPVNLVAYLDAVEREVLERALERHRYNRTAAGGSLGLSLRQMRYRMARLGVMVDEPNDLA